MPKYFKKLKDGLVLRRAETDADVERVAAFNNRIHRGEDLAGLVRALADEHPYCRRRYWFFIEEPRSKIIVSSLSLIPWRIGFGRLTLKAAELGFVGTLPEYRKRGLSRILAGRFHETVEREGFAWSFLQGIPYYYRQYGYEYAVPLENHILLPLSRVPRAPAGPIIRAAGPADTARLRELYERSMRDYVVRNERSPAIWDFLLGPSLKTEMIHDAFCVENARGRVTDYFRVARHGFGEGLILDEASTMDGRTADAVLLFLKGVARERRKPHLRLNLPRRHTLVKKAMELGAKDAWRYAFQIRIGNHGRFLKAIAPILQERLRSGALRRGTKRIVIDFYREAWSLDPAGDRMPRIRRLARAAGGSGPVFHLPPFAAVQLFFGHRSLRDLVSIYPDVQPDWREIQLWETLFPTFDSWLNTNY
ncbi:MAG: GNAT family N-acetyltransferase [Spirochaetales bacterium]|nr:GNAT family N-acetyltransferase [Spirochaetales bacterium]